MKTLVIFYSRTGNTRKVAESISKALKSDLTEIFPKQEFKGFFGFFRGGFQAAMQKTPKIKPIKKKEYDLVVIGTPVWAGNMSSPVRTFLKKLKPKSVAFFATKGNSLGKTFIEMEKLTKKPIATFSLKTAQVKGKFSVTSFTKKLK